MMEKDIRLLSIVSLFEGFAALIWLASIPSETRFYSPMRIGLLLVIFLVSVGWLILYRRRGLAAQAAQRVSNWRGKYIIAIMSICLPLLLLTAALQGNAWPLYLGEAIQARLFPILVWGSLISSQFGFFLILPASDRNRLRDSFQPMRKHTFILLACFLLIWVFILTTKVGLTSDRVGLSWGPPGTPVTFGQVTLVFTIALCIMAPLWLLSGKRKPPKVILDAMIFMGLWALAAFLWWREPMSPSYFSPIPISPNYEYYPHSDAQLFDKASHQLMVGADFKTQLVRRPLYVGMLALFHAIAGPGYEETVSLQILLLALIPAVIYRLTSEISNRFAGLLAGGLIAVREANAIHLSRELTASHAKLMMSDLVTMLGIVAILYLTVTLFKGREHSLWLFAGLGAALGLTALVRPQSLVALVPILMSIALRKRPVKENISRTLFVLLGLVLALLPWVWRNWNLTGTFLLDDRGEERLLGRNYSANPISPPAQLPDETQQEFSVRLRKEILTYALTHPDDVLFFVSNHFFHNLANSAIYIAPIYSGDSPASLIMRIPYWRPSDGNHTQGNGVFLFMNLAILSLGIAIAQHSHKVAGWIPLAVFIMYIGGNALVRTSGWRFILPVDWIILMYTCIALAYLPSRIAGMLQQRTEPQEGLVASKSSFLIPMLFGLLLLAGASVPLAEQLIPNRDFSDVTIESEEFLVEVGVLSQAQLDIFRRENDATIISGVALYPRYFQPNTRFSLADMPQGFNYLHFWLIGSGGGQIVLPLQNVPSGIPHTETVTILGCETENSISAWAVVTHSPPAQILMRDPNALLSCPLDEPD